MWRQLEKFASDSWTKRKLIGFVVLLPCKVICPVNKVKNEKATREANPRNDINLLCRKFVVSDPI